MKTITIQSIPGFEEWRYAARSCLHQGISPDQIIWSDHNGTHNDLFGDDLNIPLKNYNIKISKAFVEIAKVVICHHDTQKYALLYRVLWRIVHENKHLLNLKTDDDVMKLRTMSKAVYRDGYKITAFLRFREMNHDGHAQFIAWHEPEHYTLERVVPFFKKRFKNMNWSILTPYRAAYWDQNNIYFEDNPDPEQFPKDDNFEQYWLTYYANIFNPARLKKEAMLNQMPKKYWKNMPETKLIPDLLRTAEEKTRLMINASKNYK